MVVFLVRLLKDVVFNYGSECVFSHISPNHILLKNILMKLISIILLMLLAHTIGCSQINKYGYPFYKYYSMEEYGGTEQNWAIVKDNRGLLYVGNNDKGVLQYDGKNWKQIPIANNSIVRSLATDDMGIVYVGAVGDIGRLLPNKLGDLEYKSLLPKIDPVFHALLTDLWKTYATDSIIYFCTQGVICKYYKEKDTIKAFELPPTSSFAHLLGKELFIGNYYNGLYKHVRDTIFEQIGEGKLNRSNVFVLDKINDSIAIVGTVEKGIRMMRLPDYEILDAECPEVSDYLKDKKLYHAIVSPEFSAFATLNGGVLVADKMKPYEVYGVNSGLPSDERVAFLYADSIIQRPLWAALNNGLIRIDWHLPFRLLDERNGLSGHVSDVIRYKGKLYVATSSGLFVLNYGEIDPYFEKVNGLEQTVYSLHLFKYPGTDKEVLLVGTIRGLFEIDEKGRKFSIEEKAVNVPNEREYYVFYVGQEGDLKPNEIFIGTRNGMHILQVNNGVWSQFKEIDFKAEVRTIVYDKGGYWMGTSFKGVAFIADGADSVKFYGADKGIVSLDQNFVVKINSEITIISSNGLYNYDEKFDKFVLNKELGEIAQKNKMGISRMVRDKNYYYLNMYSDDLQRLRRIGVDGNYTQYDTTIFNRLPNVQFDVIYPDGNVVWLGASKGLFAYVKDETKNTSGKDFKVLIRGVSMNKDSILLGGAYLSDDGSIISQPINQNIRLSHKSNDIEFSFAAPFFEEEGQLKYSYKLEGYDDEWSPWSSQTFEDYNNLSAGDYVFKVKAKNIYGFVSEEESSDLSFGGRENSFSFRILPPWYMTIYAYIGYLLVLIFIIWVLVQWRTAKLIKEKQHLEDIVRQRTAEVVKQKDEIELQRDEIAAKNQSITDSIHYASRIQQALLPSKKMFQNFVPEHFILFKPRDIVSGDYYWMTHIEQRTVIVAADCTGHGVPGAFMSMLGMSFLNEIVNKNVITTSGEILNELRAHVIEALKQEGGEMKSKDGMDLSLYIIDHQKKVLEFSGANNPLYVIRLQTSEEKEAITQNDESKLPKRAVFDNTHILEEIKADKMPIGIHIKNDPFQTQVVPLAEDMMLYTFSDGYVDQFGGPKRRKFMSKAFKKLLITIYNKPMEEQRQILEDTFYKWIEEGDEVQVDDVVVLGVRIV